VFRIGERRWEWFRGHWIIEVWGSSVPFHARQSVRPRASPESLRFREMGVDVRLGGHWQIIIQRHGITEFVVFLPRKLRAVSHPVGACKAWVGVRAYGG